MKGLYRNTEPGWWKVKAPPVNATKFNGEFMEVNFVEPASLL